MADLETAKGALRALHREVKEIPGVGFAVEFRDQRFVLKGDELDAYFERKATFKKATETQIWYPGYYEYVVRFEGTGPRRYSRRSEDTLAVEAADGKTKIEIGRPSPLFCISLTDADEMERELRRFTFLGPLMPRGEGVL